MTVLPNREGQAEVIEAVIERHASEADAEIAHISEIGQPHPIWRRRSPPAAALAGLYAIRTAVPADRLDAVATVAACKSLSQVEHTLRSLKTVGLDIRPVFHRLAPQVRAQVFLCVLAYRVESHLRARRAPQGS